MQLRKCWGTSAEADVLEVFYLIALQQLMHFAKGVKELLFPHGERSRVGVLYAQVCANLCARAIFLFRKTEVSASGIRFFELTVENDRASFLNAIA